MAYRLPSDRNDRPQEHQTPSYLSDFLDHIQTLPTTVKASLTTVRTLDDRIAPTLQDANAAAEETIRRATHKHPLDAVKRQYHDFIHLQATVTEFSDNKLATANEALKNVDAVISHLDTKLALFEKQLRKEGRWPGANPQVHDKVPVIPSMELPPLPLRPQKRRREAATVSTPPQLNPATPRAAALAARVEAAAAAAALAKKEEELTLDGVEAAAVDTTLYCLCKNISHGQMVGCEGKNCAIEWFHFKCVGLTEEPKGTWYCPDCRKKNAGGRRKA